MDARTKRCRPATPGRAAHQGDRTARGRLQGTTSRGAESGPGHRRDTPPPGQPGTSIVIMGRQWGHDRSTTSANCATATRSPSPRPGPAAVPQVTGVARRRPGAGAAGSGQGRLHPHTATGASTPARRAAPRRPAREPGAARPPAGGSLSDAEQALSGDPAAWLPVTCPRLQGLLVAAVLITWAVPPPASRETWICERPRSPRSVVALVRRTTLSWPPNPLSIAPTADARAPRPAPRVLP